MTRLDEIKDVLWLYSTHRQHPTQVDEAHAALADGGDLVIDGLIWALQQADIDLKLLALQLLQERYAEMLSERCQWCVPWSPTTRTASCE